MDYFPTKLRDPCIAAPPFAGCLIATGLAIAMIVWHVVGTFYVLALLSRGVSLEPPNADGDTAKPLPSNATDVLTDGGDGSEVGSCDAGVFAFALSVVALGLVSLFALPTASYLHVRTVIDRVAEERRQLVRARKEKLEEAAKNVLQPRRATTGDSCRQGRDNQARTRTYS